MRPPFQPAAVVTEFVAPQDLGEARSVHRSPESFASSGATGVLVRRRIGRGIRIAGALGLALALFPCVATALVSSNVAYVYDFGSGSDDASGGCSGSSVFVNALTGVGVPSGTPYTTLDGLSVTITDVPVGAIDVAPGTALSGYDTVVLYQVCDIASHPNTLTAINAFLNAGGKVIILDGDRCASSFQPNYSGFLYPFATSNPGPQGASGSYTFIEASTLTANLSLGVQDGDAVGDANTFTTYDPAWCGSIKGTNALNSTGFVEAYARTANGGLAVYEGEDMFCTYGPDPHLRRVFDNLLQQPYHPDGLPCSSPVTQASCPDTMVVHYTFDDGNNLGKDTSGNGYDGIVGAASAVIGECGNALGFQPDNNREEFSAQSRAALNITGAMTGSAWILVKGQQSTDNNPSCTEGTIFSKGGNYWFQVEKNNDQLVFQNEGSGNELAKANVTIPVGTWTQVGFVRGDWNGTSQPIQLYVNGQPVTTVVTDNNVVVSGLHNQAFANSDSLMVGNYGFGDTPSACEFNGDIDDIRIYNRALSDQDMLALVSCPCADSTSCASADSLTINTGWDQSQSSLLANGDPDNDWVVTYESYASGSTPRPAFVIPAISAWHAPEPNSKWISGVPSNEVPNGVFWLENRFCLRDTLGASLCTRVRADDQATVYLNGHNLGVAGAFQPSASAVSICTSNTAFFVTGENVIRVVLDNTGGDGMGLDLVGSVHGDTPEYHVCCNDSSCAILGSKWNDLNRNGVWDTGEPPLAGWTIQLSNGRTAVTDPYGHYYFMGVVPGTYSVSEVGQAGWTLTSPPGGLYTVTLHMGQVAKNIDFGNSQFSTPAGPLIGVDWLHDAFPFNEDPSLPGTALFDTTTALIKTGRNTAQHTGTPYRFDIPGDSLVACACGESVRLDLVFRILPGPGNYRASVSRSFPTTPSMVLLADPHNQSVAAVAGDPSFWGQYLANPGPFGSGNHNGGTRWDENTWNSARMDSAEYNIFPVESLGNLPGLAPCLWSGTYHELDPKYATLGISKFRCFVVDTLQPPHSGPVIDNVKCDGTIPAWLTTVPASRTGWDGVATTREYTKIIPDGLLTPGSHVEYFIRRSSVDNPAVFTMVPDTNKVTPQYGELSVVGDPCTTNGVGSTDGHRWQEFSVLPDRWKAPGFGGAGMACVLYVDNADGHGDETAWVSVADEIGATRPFKYGAHNGWHIPTLEADPNDPTNFVRVHRGQAGTTWDMYGVRKVDDPIDGYAGSLGSRLSNRAAMAYAAGKYAQLGPTPEMLRAYYKMVYLTSADITSDILGPFNDRSQDELSLLGDFLTNAAGIMPQPRGLYVAGSGFAESETNQSLNNAQHGTFLHTDLGVMLRNPSYTALSFNGNPCADLQEVTPSLTVTNTYGLLNGAGNVHNVLQRNGAIPEADDAAWYQNVGLNGPYTASVWKQWSATRQWVAYTDGFGIQDLKNQYCVNNAGRRNYLWDVLGGNFSLICAMVGPSGITTAADDAPPAANDLSLRANPAFGRAEIGLAIARTDQGEVAVYDLSGRRTRLLLSGPLQVGMHSIAWDGKTDSGERVPPGVYFVRVRLLGAGFVQSRTLILLQ